MKVTSPGKIIFYGGYSVLLKDHLSLVIGVVDKNKNGVTAEIEEGRRIISKEFGMDFEPSEERKELVNIAYIITENYLKSKGFNKTAKIELKNSPIFGTKDEKSGLGSSAASIASVVKSLFLINDLDPNFHSETIFKLSQMAYAKYSGKIGSGFDIAVSSIGQTIIYNQYNPSELDLEGNFIEKIEKNINKPWTWVKIERFNWPSNYSVLFFNVKGGKTSSIKAVKAFKEFKKKNPKKLNEILNEQMKGEKIAITGLKERNEKKIREGTHIARSAHKKLQEEIKKLIPNADEIEPKPLENIINESEKIEGVIAGRCPGAGGWDGLAFIVKKDFLNINDIIKIGKEENLFLDQIDINIL